MARSGGRGFVYRLLFSWYSVTKDLGFNYSFLSSLMAALPPLRLLGVLWWGGRGWNSVFKVALAFSFLQYMFVCGCMGFL